MQKKILALFLWTNFMIAIEFSANNSASNIALQINSQGNGLTTFQD